MSINDRDLAPYEENLLTELREVVASRQSSVAVRRSPEPARRRRLALAVAAVAGLAAVIGVGAPALLGTGQRPAYAIERDRDGSIRIYIREYRDAQGLQAKLRAFGVSAVVDYVPNGKQCREPRASYIPDDQVPRGLLTTEPPPGDEEAYWKLHPELIPPGHTFVYTTTLIGEPGDKEWSARGHMALATGPVAPCELVPGPVLPRNGG